MRRLSSLILILVLSAALFAQKSPHGSSFKSNCEDCHKTNGWKVDLSKVTFDHNRTKFPLAGQHQVVSCKDCHKSLEFAKTQSECNSCHTDVHEQTVGNECARCHTPNSWMVTNIAKLHQQSRFPLLGAHAVADCKACHKNLFITNAASGAASRLRIDPLGTECYDCHKDNYIATTTPNHVQGNYSKNCTDCHNMTSNTWSGAGINHNFFPLEGGHAIAECKTCHTSGSYSKIPSQCISCHQADYSSAQSPNHTSLNLSTNCKDCHSLTPGWKPADFANHDAVFPIYSGKHKGEWNSCADCHTNPANYGQFSCVACHEHNNKSDVDKDHSGVAGYSYTSTSCYACHPTGSKAGSFDHNKSGFPLTGAHVTTACTDCHTTGYAGTSNVCASCHTNNYNQTTNPKHMANNISNDCAECHTTNPGWKPATFPTHNQYYVIEGAHVPIANDCAKCHNGNYTNSPNTCFGCHAANYNQTTKPNHTTSKFPTACETCHSQNSWVPSTFNHASVYPLTGLHATVACDQCHTTGYVNTPNTCAACHTNDYNQTTKPNHSTSQIPKTCETCHTTAGWVPSTFNHTAVYPLVGSHTSVACIDCHTTGYVNTPNTCAACHTNDYNQTTNPNHTAALFPKTCETCHTPTAWVPSSFNHATIYPLTGAHSKVTCTQCHANGYANTPGTCEGCHTTDYNQTTNPNHATSQFPKTCETCHTTTAWIPSNFNHTAVYPLTGAHTTVACTACHKNGYPNTPTNCVGCHQPDYNSSANPSHTKIGISTDCKLCHTTNAGWEPALYPTHNSKYVITGAHTTLACASCHKGNYNNTPNTCAGCHLTKYNATTAPNHVAAAFNTTCQTCHSQTAWTPSTWSHTSYFPINVSRHNLPCATCHTNSSNYAIFNCLNGCHSRDHNQSQGSAGCYRCHPTGKG